MPFFTLFPYRFISNHLLLSPPSHTNPADTSVEWAYAFDVHTNAFFPFYLTLYLAQLFLVPIVLMDNWVCLWVGNTLYLAGYVRRASATGMITEERSVLLGSLSIYMEYTSG